MRDHKDQLSPLTIFLHWIVAVTIIALLAVGLYMEETKTYSLYPIHKSIGMIILIPVVIRVFWRLLNGWPEPANQYQKMEHLLAKLVHWVLIIATVLMPVSGMIMSGAGGHGLHIFGWELLAHGAPDPDGGYLPLNASLAGIGHTIHNILGKVLIAAIVLHIIGAIKHHVIDKDNTLARMLGKKHHNNV